MKNLKKCCYYLRVSTLDQDYERQKNDLNEHVKLRQYALPEAKYIFKDKVSGFKSKKERDGLRELMDFLQANDDVKDVFISELSRLARKQSILHELKEFFIEKKINLHIVKEQISLLQSDGTLNKTADMMISFLAAFAQNEADTMKHRFNSQKKLNKINGKYQGGKMLFGYDKDENKYYIIDKKNSQIVKEVFKMYLNGMSISSIWKECIARNYSEYTKSKRNIAKLLKEEGYTGEKLTTSYKKGGNAPRYLIKYPQIITNETFRKVQEQLQINKTKVDKTRKRIALLRPLIRCNVCRRYYVADWANKGQNSAYKCNNKCESQISVNLLDNVIWAWTKRSFNFESLAYQNYKKEFNSDDKEKQIAFIEKFILEKKDSITVENNIYRNDYKISNNKAQCTITYQNKINKIKKEISVFETQIKELKSEIKENEMNKMKEFLIGYQPENVEKDKERVKKLIHTIIKEIRIVYSDRLYSLILVQTMTNREEYILVDKSKRPSRAKVIPTEYFKLRNKTFKLNGVYIEYECNMEDGTIMRHFMPIDNRDIKEEVFSFEGIMSLDNITELNNTCLDDYYTNLKYGFDNKLIPVPQKNNLIALKLKDNASKRNKIYKRRWHLINKKANKDNSQELLALREQLKLLNQEANQLKTLQCN